MAFQPFGYRFEISSSLTPTAAKEAIRAKRKRWLEVKSGARGWIVGPFVCLWFSALNRDGPMLFGVISGDSEGTRIHGRAGSDLNGVLAYSLALPILLFVTWLAIANGQATVRMLIVVAFLALVGSPLVYRFANLHKRSAEPLVRFLENTLAPADYRVGEKVSDP